MSNRKLFRYLSLAIAFVISTGLILTSASGAFSNLFGAQSASAQLIRPDGIWQQIYQKLPDLPLENQYINKETKKVDPENTLVSRLIRYHLYVKGRSPLYRLDWKLTLADYLGISSPMEESTYPSHNTLRKNPLEGDVAVINRLNQAQRNALVQALVDAFTPQASSSSGMSPSSTPSRSAPTP